MSTGNIGIKVLVDGAGGFGLVCFVVAIMPMITWGTPINEATQQVIDFTTTAVCAVVSYAIADVFGSAGYMISTGSK